MGSEQGNSTGSDQHHHLTATPERESNFSSASGSKKFKVWKLYSILGVMICFINHSKIRVTSHILLIET